MLPLKKIKPKVDGIAPTKPQKIKPQKIYRCGPRGALQSSLAGQYKWKTLTPKAQHRVPLKKLRELSSCFNANHARYFKLNFPQSQSPSKSVSRPESVSRSSSDSTGSYVSRSKSSSASRSKSNSSEYNSPLKSFSRSKSVSRSKSDSNEYNSPLKSFSRPKSVSKGSKSESQSKTWKPPPVFDISGLDWRTRRDQWPDNEYSDDELGEGYYDVKARAYDKKMANVFNYDFDCKKEYRDDVVSLENLATLQKTDPDAIEHSSTGRCFVLASLVQSWNNGLAYFDKESGRVVPQYPRDPQTRSDNMPPEELFWFYDRAVALGQWKVNKSKPQAIDAILSENVRNALVDIYRFIIAYDALQISYGFTDDKKIEKNDIAFFSRRDIQASQWLEKIYKKYGVDSMFGTRKYTDIPSGRNAPQVFYSCFLVALIRSLGFRAKLDPDQNVTWRFEAGECDEFTNERDICRPCVHKWIIKPKA